MDFFIFSDITAENLYLPCYYGSLGNTFLLLNYIKHKLNASPKQNYNLLLDEYNSCQGLQFVRRGDWGEMKQGQVEAEVKKSHPKGDDDIKLSID